jgi:ubiquinone/menaquinone biosynthesis C-methylase UbiE
MGSENTYFLYNKSEKREKEELQRLIAQDNMLTRAVKESVPEHVHSVLDVACGTGGWTIAMAKQSPATRFVGIDITSKMIEYARHQAKVEGLDDRMEFFVMDALRPLEFPTASFDLVHMRFGMSFLRTWDWPKLLAEFGRVTKPDGIIRVIESDFISTPHPAFNQLVAWSVQAMYAAGHFFKESRDGLTSELPQLFSRFGWGNIHSTEYVMQHTYEDQVFFEDMRTFYRLFVPFLHRWTRFPPNYEEVYQQALQEMQQKDFEAAWRLVLVEGQVR